MQVSHRIFGDAGNLDKKEAEIAPCFLGFPVKSDVLRAPPNRPDRHAPTPAPVAGSLVIAMPPIGRMSVAPAYGSMASSCDRSCNRSAGSLLRLRRVRVRPPSLRNTPKVVLQISKSPTAPVHLELVLVPLFIANDINDKSRRRDQLGGFFLAKPSHHSPGRLAEANQTVARCLALSANTTVRSCIGT